MGGGGWTGGGGEAYFLHFPSNDGDLVTESISLDQFLTVDGHVACLNGVHLPSSCLCSKERENACVCVGVWVYVCVCVCMCIISSIHAPIHTFM